MQKTNGRKFYSAAGDARLRPAGINRRMAYLTAARLSSTSFIIHSMDQGQGAKPLFFSLFSSSRSDALPVDHCGSEPAMRLQRIVRDDTSQRESKPLVEFRCTILNCGIER